MSLKAPTGLARIQSTPELDALRTEVENLQKELQK